MSDYGVILFYTTSSVMRAEKILTGEGHTIKLVPTPRQFSSDCGIAIRFNWEKQPAIGPLLEATNVEYEAIHQLT